MNDNQSLIGNLKKANQVLSAMNDIRPISCGLLACLGALLLAGCATPPPTTSRAAFTGMTVNGQPVRMVLDTGAASTVIHSIAANRLGLRFAQPKKGIAAGEFEVVAGMSEPANVAKNGQSISVRIPVVIVRNTLDNGVDGVIGWPEVRNNVMAFDPANRIVHLAEHIPDGEDGWLKFKIHPHDTLLLETTLPDGNAGILLVDTGAPQSVQLPKEKWEDLRAAHPDAPVKTAKYSNWSIGNFTTQSMLLDALQIGPLRLKRISVETMAPAELAWLHRSAPQAEILGVLGLGALNQIDLVVDGKKGSAWLRPKTKPARFQPGPWTVANDVPFNCDTLLVRSGIDECSHQDFDAAIVDYNRAIDLNPENPKAFANRAMTELEKQDLPAAIADETRALEIDPNNLEYYADRAVTRQIHGDFSDALADYDKMIELDPDHSIAAQLNRQTLLRRLGRPTDDFLDIVSAWPDGWNKTLALFVADRLDENTLLEVAQHAEGIPVQNLQCEAFYYIGLKHLLDGDKDGARGFFQDSLATGVRKYSEYRFAAAELTRLGYPAQEPTR
jgi:lipoprotein NlpI